MNGPTGHFAAGVITGIALATSVIGTVLQRSRPTTIGHSSGGDLLPALVSEAAGVGLLDTLSYLVQLGFPGSLHTLLFATWAFSYLSCLKAILSHTDSCLTCIIVGSKSDLQT